MPDITANSCFGCCNSLDKIVLTDAVADILIFLFGRPSCDVGDVYYNFSDGTRPDLRVAKEYNSCLCISPFLLDHRRCVPLRSIYKSSSRGMGLSCTLSLLRVYHVCVALRNSQEVQLRSAQQGSLEMDPWPRPQPWHRPRARNRPRVLGAGDRSPWNLLTLRNKSPSFPQRVGICLCQICSCALRGTGGALPYRPYLSEAVPHVPMHREVRIQGLTGR